MMIPSDLVRATKMTEQEILREIAVMLFEKEKLTLGQAAKLADMPQFQFQFLVGSRGISMHYGLSEFEEDLQTIKSLGL